MMGYSLTNPTIEGLLGEFASIKDPDYFDITDNLGVRQKEYIQRNKLCLLEQFTTGLETTLSELSTPQTTS